MKVTPLASALRRHTRSEHSKRHSGVLIAGCALLLSTALVSRAAAQATNYTAKWLGSFSASEINAKGQAAGYILLNGGLKHAAIYSGGKIIDLGVLPGGDSSQATSINAGGVVVGDSNTTGGVTHAFRWVNGVMTDLGTLPGGVESHAADINDAGQIVGWGVTTRPNTTWPSPDHAFIYSGGVMKDLGNISSNFANFSHAHAINASGDVVGWGVNDNFETHAFLYRGGVMIDLGTLGGSESRAHDISDNGTVVGWSYTADDGEILAFKHMGGTMTTIGKLTGELGSSAKAINKLGDITGSSIESGSPAFILTPTGGMTRLDSRVFGTGWNLEDAVSINDSGQILATGSQTWTSSGSYLLTPAPAGPEIEVTQPATSSLVDGNSKKSFGTVKVGRTGSAKTFTITNAGSSKLTGLAITMTGQQKGDFVVSAPTKTSLPPGSSTTFKVTFKPRAKGTRNAAIHIKSNDPNENPFDIKLTGQGAN
jgi:probable HAF family extracellular repeat protein